MEGMKNPWRSLPAAAFYLLLVVSCTVQVPGITPEQQQEVNDLRGELALVQASIVSAVDEDSKYTGGLIKTLVAYRLEILRVLPPVPDSVLRLVLAVDSTRLPCGHDVAPLISMMDRNPPPMLACPLTPIHAPMPVFCSIGGSSSPKLSRYAFHRRSEDFVEP